MSKRKKKKKHEPKAAEAELNIMPFIDIFSMLNVFLLVSATFINIGLIRVQVPFLTGQPFPHLTIEPLVTPHVGVIPAMQMTDLKGSIPVAFEALQRESGVPLNAVPGDATAAQAAPDAAALGAQAPFFADVLAGRWDKALPAAAAFELPAPVAAALYEHVVLELVEHRDANSARAMLRSTVALGTWMRRHEPQRYARLDNLVKRCGTLNGTREVYGDTDRDARRRALALQLHGEVSVAAPGRLLDLVGCGLRYLRVTGRMFELAPHVRKRARGGGDGGAAGGPPLAWDLLMNTELAPLAKARRRDADGDEAPVIPPLADGARHAQAIRFGSTSHPTCASYSPDGFFLAIVWRLFVETDLRWPWQDTFRDGRAGLWGRGGCGG